MLSSIEPAGAGPYRKGTLSEGSRCGILTGAPSSGSRPHSHWCCRTRCQAWSQVPCAVQWLQPGVVGWLIPIKRVSILRDLAAAWRGEEWRVAKRANQQEKPGETQGTGRHRKRKRKGMCLEDRPVLVANAGGIDIGAREIFVAVPPDRDQDPVRIFETFTEDLERMADWLLRCGVTTVALESTGVYWIPLYEVLEAKGVTPCLVDASHMKNVPGRRTDWHECQWLQYLHSVGLLRAAFRPDEEVCAVRALVRHRGELVAMASQHVQHMQKALTQMNFQIQPVISDITGVTGMAILDAILAGQRDPVELAKLRDSRIKASEEVVRKSLVGNCRAAYLFPLRQSRDLYRTYQHQILDCDQEVEKLLSGFESRVDPTEKPLPPDRKRFRKKNRKKAGHHCGAGFDLRTEAYKL